MKDEINTNKTQKLGSFAVRIPKPLQCREQPIGVPYRNEFMIHTKSTNKIYYEYL
jgi:hypothetical protein